jgi:hypothetical protein
MQIIAITAKGQREDQKTARFLQHLSELTFIPTLTLDAA